MELVSAYFKNYLYLLRHAIDLWNKEHVKATPEIASYIEKHAGITRHDFDEHCKAVISSEDEHPDDVMARAVLAFIIFCIDNQDFEALGAALGSNPLQ